MIWTRWSRIVLFQPSFPIPVESVRSKVSAPPNFIRLPSRSIIRQDGINGYSAPRFAFKICFKKTSGERQSGASQIHHSNQAHWTIHSVSLITFQPGKRREKAGRKPGDGANRIKSACRLDCFKQRFDDRNDPNPSARTSTRRPAINDSRPGDAASGWPVSLAPLRQFW